MLLPGKKKQTAEKLHQSSPCPPAWQRPQEGFSPRAQKVQSSTESRSDGTTQALGTKTGEALLQEVKMGWEGGRKGVRCVAQEVFFAKETGGPHKNVRERGGRWWRSKKRAARLQGAGFETPRQHGVRWAHKTTPLATRSHGARGVPGERIRKTAPCTDASLGFSTNGAGLAALDDSSGPRNTPVTEILCRARTIRGKRNANTKI